MARATRPRRSRVSSARAKVLGTVELVETILHYVSEDDLLDVFAAMRISRFFHGVIKGSLALQRQLFFAPDQNLVPTVGSMRFNPLFFGRSVDSNEDYTAVEGHGSPLFCNAVDMGMTGIYYRLVDGKQIKSNDHVARLHKDKLFQHQRNQFVKPSWRRMALTQPSTAEAFAEWTAIVRQRFPRTKTSGRTRYIPPHSRSHANVLNISEHGITLGQIFDVLELEFDEESSLHRATEFTCTISLPPVDKLLSQGQLERAMRASEGSTGKLYRVRPWEDEDDLTVQEELWKELAAVRPPRMTRSKAKGLSRCGKADK